MSSTTASFFSSLLRNCVPLTAIFPAKQIHAQILVHGFRSNVTLQTDLVLVYSRSGVLTIARKVFDKMQKRNMHSWNILLSSYVNNSLFDDALSFFHEFMKGGLRPDHFTLPPVFKACAGIRDFYLGVSLHSWVIRLGFEEYVVVASSALDYYVKCGNLVDAKSVFERISIRDSVTWNSMISGFARAGTFSDALDCFRNMLEEGVEIDSMMIPTMLNVCGKEGELRKGKELHTKVVKDSIFHGDIAIGNSLIDMYAKCGCLKYSEKVFRIIDERDLVTWTTMISCYGLHGKGQESLILFNEMRCSGFKPNCVTFTAILASCSHSGLIEEGRKIFDSIRDFGDTPRVEHYTCMVDLLGRFGHLEEALDMIENMKLVSSSSVWGALLAGCVMHKNVVIGEIAAQQLFELEPENPSNYIALCGIYDSVGMRDGVKIIRAMIKVLKMQKNPGCSWIIIAGRVHKFYQGTLLDPHGKMMYDTLDGAIKDPVFPEILGE